MYVCVEAYDVFVVFGGWLVHEKAGIQWLRQKPRTTVGADARRRAVCSVGAFGCDAWCMGKTLNVCLLYIGIGDIVVEV